MIATFAAAVAAAAALAAPAPALRIDGPAAGAHFGASVAGAGDVDGDGHADIVVGSPLGVGGQACSGTAYVLFGPFAAGTLDLRTEALRGIEIRGARCRELAGTSVAGAGDVNGDGLDDVIVGAPAGSPEDEGLAIARGRAYVVFGRRTGGTVDLARLREDEGLVVKGPRRTVTDAFGFSVAGAGDTDGDGLDDVVIAAPGNPGFEERSQRGSAYLVYGRREGGTLRAGRLGRGGMRIGRTGAGGLRAVAGAGDVNGDGRGDVVLGDTSAAHGRGGAVVVLGGPRRRSLSLGRLGRRGFAIGGRDRAADTGYAVAGGGDVNGDGLDDVIVSAPQGGRTRANTARGGAFVIFGRRRPRPLDLRAPRGRWIEIRGGARDWAGFAVAAAGRVDGDRRADVALLAHGSLAVVRGRRAAGRIALDALPPSAGFVFDGTVEPNQWYTDAASGGFITAGAVGADAGAGRGADLLAGVRMADHNDRPDSGSAYVLFAP